MKTLEQFNNERQTSPEDFFSNVGVPLLSFVPVFDTFGSKVGKRKVILTLLDDRLGYVTDSFRIVTMTQANDALRESKDLPEITIL